MKRLFCVVLLVLALVGMAQAGPFVRCDQYTAAMGDPDYFKVFVDSGIGVQSTTYVYPGETGDSCHYDLVGIPPGQHTIKIQSCKNGDPIWQPGEVCTADSLPLVFTKPSPVTATSVPTGLRLQTQ